LALSDPLSKYGDFMRDNVFKPIGMNDSGHHEHDEDVIPRLAVGYNPKGAADVEKPPHLEWTSKTGNGSLYSTPRDLLKFCNAQILKLETLRFSQGDNPSHRGYFWFTRTRFGHPTLYISGSSPGYKAFIERFMDEDVIVIVLSNLYLASPTIIGEDIGAIVHGEKTTGNPPKCIHMTAAALAKFERTFKYGADFYVPNNTIKIIAHDDYLEVTPQSPPLVPIGNDEFFDRAYWSFVRFEEGKLIYRNAGDVFVAVKQ
jgi:hypothetical protein